MQTETCPYCRDIIKVEVGHQSCPKCHELITVSTDESELAILHTIAYKAVAFLQAEMELREWADGNNTNLPMYWESYDRLLEGVQEARKELATALAKYQELTFLSMANKGK